jgi:hypothetical protein
LPPPVRSAEPWSKGRIEREAERIRANPTPVERLQALMGFVQQERYALKQFGGRPGFAMQHAFNHAPGGPVHEAAALALQVVEAPLLALRWSDTDRCSPKPALLRTLESKNPFRAVSVAPDGRRAVSAGGWTL